MTIVMRLISLILIVIALMLLGADAVTSLEKGGYITVRSLGTVWSLLDKGGLDAFKSWVQNHAAFAAQFADPGFIAYVRTTDTVDLAADGARAAETGRWVGTWKGGIEMSGVYMAAWRERRGQWLLERELYVTLRG